MIVVASICGPVAVATGGAGGGGGGAALLLQKDMVRVVGPGLRAGRSSGGYYSAKLDGERKEKA